MLIQQIFILIVLKNYKEDHLNLIFVLNDFAYIVVFLSITELSILILIIHLKSL